MNFLELQQHSLRAGGAMTSVTALERHIYQVNANEQTQRAWLISFIPLSDTIVFTF